MGWIPWLVAMFVRFLPALIGGILVLLALGRYAVLLAAAGAVLPFFSRYRRWLVDHPLYVRYLSRAPGWRLPTVGRLVLATPIYVLILGKVAEFFIIEIGGYPPNSSSSDNPLLWLRDSVLGPPLAIAGLGLIVVLLRRQWPFRNRTTPSEASPLPASRLRRIWKLDPAAWQHDHEGAVRASLGGLWPLTEQKVVAILSLSVRVLPLYGIGLLVFFAMAAFAALCYYGVLLGTIGAALAPARSYRNWLVRQPGYRRCFSRFLGPQPPTVVKLAIVTLLVFASPSLLFWLLFFEDSFKLHLVDWNLATLAVVGVPFLLGLVLRDWLPLLPGRDFIRSRRRRYKRWSALLEPVDGLRLQGRFPEALDLVEQALAMARRIFGEGSLEHATSLDRMGGLLASVARYGEAERLLQEALVVRRRKRTDAHPEVAETLHKLGALYAAMGRYVEAEPVLRQSLSLRRALIATETAGYLETLTEIASLSLETGDFVTARSTASYTIEYPRVLWKGPDLFTERATRVLGLLHKELGDLAGARALLERGVALCQAIHGPSHFRFASACAHLADVSARQGDLEKARLLVDRALPIQRRTWSGPHPEIAVTLQAAAVLHLASGDPANAERFERKGIAILRSTVGDEHPSLAAALQRLAALCLAEDRSGEALDLASEALAIEDRAIEQIFLIGSESQHLAYLTSRRESLEKFLILVSRHFPDAPPVVCRAFALVLRRKGIVTELAMRRRGSILAGVHPELEPKLRKLEELDLRIARRALAGPGLEGLKVHQRMLGEWSTARDRLDAELSRRMPDPERGGRLRSIDRSSLAEALPAGSALVELVRIGDPSVKTGRYGAFILLAGEPGKVRMIDIGEARAVDAMIAEFRAWAAGGFRSDPREIDDDREGLRCPVEAQGRELRSMVFDPLLPALAGRTRLFIAPDGDLSLLPFETLPGESGAHLIDTYEISYLGVGRDLLGIRAPRGARPPGPPVVMADPDFDLRWEGDLPVQSPGRSQSRDLKRNGFHFAQLPGTRLEGETISGMLGVEALFGSRALKGVLRSLRSPWILHIATHGFFLPDRQGPSGAGLEGSPPGDRPDLLAGLENPLLRSGLALAGANAWMRGGTPPVEAQDGILNAVDVANLDLTATDLVVLSACETGLGRVEVGEGVFGLRRAFALAGAKTLVMSLWKVPDRQTAELMEIFYRRLLAGEPRAQALREAQRELKRRDPHPLFWGAFICQGDPGPLTGSLTPIHPPRTTRPAAPA